MPPLRRRRQRGWVCVKIDEAHGDATCPVCGEMKSDATQATCGDDVCARQYAERLAAQETS